MADQKDAIETKSKKSNAFQGPDDFVLFMNLYSY